MPSKAKLTWRQRLGLQSELTAQRFLESKGFVALARNYRCKLGEIDLIMLDGAVLVFIEVRYRKSRGYGSAIDTIDARKQTRIRNTARHFLHTHQRFHDHCCRFDVLGIDVESAGRENFQWIPDAFY
jgi:putative endonuclease